MSTPLWNPLTHFLINLFTVLWIHIHSPDENDRICYLSRGIIKYVMAKPSLLNVIEIKLSDYHYEHGVFLSNLSCQNHSNM